MEQGRSVPQMDSALGAELLAKSLPRWSCYEGFCLRHGPWNTWCSSTQHRYQTPSSRVSGPSPPCHPLVCLSVEHHSATSVSWLEEQPAPSTKAGCCPSGQVTVTLRFHPPVSQSLYKPTKSHPHPCFALGKDQGLGSLANLLVASSQFAGGEGGAPLFSAREGA